MRAQSRPAFAPLQAPSSTPSRFPFLALLALLSLASLAFAADLPAGPWTLQTELNESDARALLAQLSFQPDPSSEGRWLVSSQTLLLSDAQGNLVPTLSLSSSCARPANCTSSADLYHSQNGSIRRMGRLQSKTSSFFTPPSSGAAAPEPPDAINESATPLASLAPMYIPPEWLWAIALGIVLLITGTFLMRNRD